MNEFRVKYISGEKKFFLNLKNEIFNGNSKCMNLENSCSVHLIIMSTKREILKTAQDLSSKKYFITR